MLPIITYIQNNGLDAAIKEFKLKSKIYDTNKIILKYDQIESNMSLSEVQDCRGLILEMNTWKIISMSFRKFFNSEETNAAKIDWNTAHILEKIDGSMIQVYWDWNKNKWFAGTTGTAEGEGQVNNKLGTTFNRLFWETVQNKYNFKDESLNKKFTYVFELATPYNIVVKPHGESSATLLAIRNNETLEEISYTNLMSIAAELGIPLVKSFDLNSMNTNAIIKTFEGMSWSEEGYVVVDSNFNRIKIKNPAYVAVHHLKNKTAEHHILTIVKSNEIEEFSATFPERKEELLKLKTNYDALILRLKNTWSELENSRPKDITADERKKFAITVFDVAATNNVKMFTGLFFSLQDGKVTDIDKFMFEYDDKILYKIL